MRFADIPGLDTIKRQLIASVQNGLVAHARLFIGQEGALNLPLALANATYIHCENRTETDACGTCPSCVKNQKFIHPDTHFVFPVSNVKSEKDEERFRADMLKTWRSFLTEHPFGNFDSWVNYFGGEDKRPIISTNESRNIMKTLAFKPFESKYKVMIIWLPELMHTSAANSILKILEEPAPHTYFILVTNDVNNVIQTIQSRTQSVNVPLLNDNIISTFLVERYDQQPAHAERLARLANGKLANAIALIDEEETNEHEFFTGWMRSCFKSDFATLVDKAGEFHDMDKLTQQNILLYGMNMFRETLLVHSDAGALHRVQEEELKFARDFSSVVSFPVIERSVTLMNEAAYHLERNGSARMIFLDLSLNLSKMMGK